MNRFFSILIFLVFTTNLIYAQVFNYIVAKDGSGTDTTITSAVIKCQDNVRSIIFVKKGTYKEKVMIGSHSIASKKIISLIGEDALNTIITWDDYNGRSIIYDGKTVTSGTPQSATFTVNASDFYAENISIINSYTNAQAVAYYGVGDRQTFKNCRFIGYQDTHYTKKGRRFYFQKCYIEGGVDYICAGGTCVFDSCTLYSVRNGGSITAPEDITAYTTVGTKKYYCGFIFRNCNLTSPTGITPYLGRPWQATSSSVFMNCKMENIKPEGWSIWSGTNHLSSFFAEYNSMNPDGTALDVSNRVTWSYQLTKDEVDTYYTNTKIYSFNTAAYNPFSLVIAPFPPVSVTVSGNNISWSAVDNATGYVVFKNGLFLAATNNTTYTDNSETTGVYTVKSVGIEGQISENAASVTGLNDIIEKKNIHVFYENNVIRFSEQVISNIYNTNGKLIINSKDYSTFLNTGKLNKGFYLVVMLDNKNKLYTQKLIISKN